MPTREPFAMAELLAQPWAMEPKALEAFAAEVCAVNELAEGQAMVPTDQENGSAKAYDLRDGVAHIAIDGPMLKRVSPVMKYFGIRATATPDVALAVDRAIADDSVKSIMLDIDSPGGIVSSIPELADKIAEANKLKPVFAHAGDMIASAAYWVGSQARKLTASRSSLVGSIGVYNVVVDSSAQAERQGVKVHVVSSAPLKGAGVPGSKVTEDQIGDARRLVGDYNAMFQAAVQNGRGMTAADAASVATGQVWLAEEAKANGLIDEISSPDAAHATAKNTSIAAAISATACVETSPQFGAEVGTMADQVKGAETAASTEKLQAQLSEAQAEIASFKAAVAEMQKQSRKALIEKYAGHVAPSMAQAVEQYGDFCGADLAKFEAHLKSLPVVVRSERISTDAKQEIEQTQAVSDKQAKQADALGIKAEEAEFLAQFRTVNGDGSMVKHDGTTVSAEAFKRDRAAWLKRFGIAAALLVSLVLGAPTVANASALTAARATASKNLGPVKTYLMKASTTIYAGSLVAIDSDGLAIPAAASASNHGCAGVATKTVTSAASGSYYMEVQEGWFKFAATTIAQANVGSLVYAEDDQTVDETRSANEPVAGLLVEYVSASVGWVWVSPVFMGNINNIGGTAITLTNGATIDNETNNVIKFAENSEDLLLTVASNKITASSTTGVVTWDWGNVLPVSSATGALGWGVASGANTACNTTCTYACVFGQDADAAGKPIVDCTNAAADICVCAGAN